MWLLKNARWHFLLDYKLSLPRTTCKRGLCDLGVLGAGGIVLALWWVWRNERTSEITWRLLWMELARYD